MACVAGSQRSCASSRDGPWPPSGVQAGGRWSGAARQRWAGPRRAPGRGGRVLGRWEWPERPAWVTFVPSRRHPKLVKTWPNASPRLAACRSIRSWSGPGSPPQLEMANSAHQCRNVHGAFAVTGPVPQVERCWSTTAPTPNGPSRSSGPGSARPAPVLSTRWSSYGAARTNRSDCWLPVIPYSYGCTTSLPVGRHGVPIMARPRQRATAETPTRASRKPSGDPDRPRAGTGHQSRLVAGRRPRRRVRPSRTRSMTSPGK